MRLGEITYNSTDQPGSARLTQTKVTRGSIKFSPNYDHARLILPRSKTDVKKQGVSIMLAATPNYIQPHLTMFSRPWTSSLASLNSTRLLDIPKINSRYGFAIILWKCPPNRAVIHECSLSSSCQLQSVSANKWSMLFRKEMLRIDRNEDFEVAWLE
jgi:hypothetical protein